jgi:multidrug resistance efflux pump
METFVDQIAAAGGYRLLVHPEVGDPVPEVRFAAAEHDEAAFLVVGAEGLGIDLHQAEAVLKMRSASLKKSQVDMEHTTIYAPIDGVVISRNVDAGQTVASSFNTPTLFQIA